MSSETSPGRTNIVVKLKPGDFDFWNTTLYEGYSLVPWIGFDVTTTSINSLSDTINTDYFSPV